MSHSKESITNRMLKYALNFWHISHPEDLDPLVKLILEALSAEIYNVSNEVKDAHARILEKVANLLAPEFLTAPHPAHALLRAFPSEKAEVLTNTTSFFTTQKSTAGANELPETNPDIYFTPVDNVKVYDARVAYIQSGSYLYEYDNAFNRQLKAHSSNRNPTEGNTIWIGLKVNPLLENLDGLYFCFDWKNMEPALGDRLYALLPLTKWYLNGEELTMAEGMQYEVDTQGASFYNQQLLDYNLVYTQERDIKHYYNHKFISIAGGTGGIKQNTGVYPAIFNRFFAENDLKELRVGLTWLQVVFPAGSTPGFADELQVYVNTFPVVNRQLNHLNFRLKGGSNIIPVLTPIPWQFLAVKSLSDDVHQYESVPFRNMEEDKKGSYTLRNGGVERFDTRNASELLNYLAELLRSESAAFSAYGHDFVATLIKELNQRIVLIEQKTKGLVNSLAEMPNYLIVKPFEGHEMMYTTYWTTLASAGNFVRSGTRLEQGPGNRLKSESLALVSTSTGGKNRLRPEDKINAFRYGLITRNRIVTKEDIRHFCLYELGSRIKAVAVEKGFEMSSHPRQAFLRTINVILVPSGTETLNEGQWQLVCSQLKSKLEARSGISNHYRIVVKDVVEFTSL